MKKFLAVLVVITMMSTMLAIPAMAGKITLPQSFPAEGNNDAYYAYDFTVAANAQEVIDNSTDYECLADSSLSVAEKGLKITSDSVADNGIVFSNMPAGDWYAKIIYKFDKATLSENADGEVLGAASFIIDGSDIVDFATATVNSGEKNATFSNLDGDTVTNGNFTSSVVALSGISATSTVTLSPTYFDGYSVNSEFVLAYIGLFKTEKAAQDFDPTVSSISLMEYTAEIDNFAHTAQIALADDVSALEAAFAKENYLVEMTSVAGSAAAKYDAAKVEEHSDYLTSTMVFEVTGLDNKKVDWTVSAKSNFSSFSGPEFMLDFSEPGMAEQAIEEGLVAQTSVDKNLISARNLDYGGPAIEMDATIPNYTDKYAHALFKFKGADTTRKWYVKFAYMFSNVKWPSSYSSDKGLLKIAWDNAPKWNDDENFTWTSSTLPEQLTWKTHVVAIDGSSNANDIANKQLHILFNGITCKACIKYVALFSSYEDAVNYDPSIKMAKLGDRRASINPYDHLMTIELDKDLGEAGIPDFKAEDIDLTLYSADVDTELTLQRGYSPANTKVEALSQNSSYFVNERYKYKEIKYKVTNCCGEVNEWSFQLRSEDSSYVPPIEPKAFIDGANIKSSSVMFTSPDKTTVSRNMGMDKIGNINVPYFKWNNPDSRTVMDNWHIVNMDTSKADTKAVSYVKFAFRLSEDAKIGTNPNQSLNLHVAWYSNSWTTVKAYGADNLKTLGKAWNEWIVELPASSVAADRFIIGTWGIDAKIYLKYVAVFDNIEDARAWKYGEKGAQIVSEGNTITANFDNVEDSNSSRTGSQVLAIYDEDGKLVKTVMDSQTDILSVSDLQSGKYTAKASVLKMNNLRPLMKSVKEQIDIE